jgi:F0F1-type ATP synthase membrane subunit b/b'
MVYLLTFGFAIFFIAMQSAFYCYISSILESKQDNVESEEKHGN